MAGRIGIPLTFTGRTLSDTSDSTNVGSGAMRSLQNLIPDPTTKGYWVCRPGQVPYDMSGPTNPGFISGGVVVGNIFYGLIASDLTSGHDQPFAYDLTPGVGYLTVNGITADNVPTSPATSGDWVPPILAQVGSRVIVTHPGFPGSPTDNPADYGVKFGWFDVSSFNVTTSADVVNGQPFVYAGPDLVLGVQPGMTVSGTNIPASTVVKNVYSNTTGALYFVADSHTTDIIDNISGGDFPEMELGKIVIGPGVQAGTTVIGTPTGSSIQLSKPTLTSETSGTFLVYGNMPAPIPYSGDFTLGSKDILNVTVTDLHTGQILSGAAIPAGSMVVSISGSTVTMSQAALLTVTAISGSINAVFRATGSVVELSANATGDGAAEAVVIAGGTPDEPLWGAGDTAINFLPSVPVGVGEMNGRAWFACLENGIPFSDSLLPCIISNTLGVQALRPGNGLDVTAIGATMLGTPLTGGSAQTLFAFQGDNAVQQILGDPETGNLTMNVLPVPTGTLAPNSIVSTSYGVFFVSPEGLRLIDLAGRISDPIGQDGSGIVQAFLNLSSPHGPSTAPPSRVSAAANSRTLRIDVPTLDASVASYWFDVTRKIWTGPHTGGASLVKRWADTFVITPFDTEGELNRADDNQDPNSVYTEGGDPIDWVWESSLLPDNAQVMNVAMVESMISLALPLGLSVTVTFMTDDSDPIDAIAMPGVVLGTMRQRQIPWTKPLVFKQGIAQVTGVAAANITVGNFYMLYQLLSYPGEWPPDFLLANDGVTILDSNADEHLTPDEIVA